MPRQAPEVLAKNLIAFVENYSMKRGFAPSYREIADGVGVSYTTVMKCVARLSAEGRVSHAPGVARSLRVKR